MHGRTIAFQFVRDDHPRHIGQPLQELAEESLRSLLIPAALHKNIQQFPESERTQSPPHSPGGLVVHMHAKIPRSRQRLAVLTRGCPRSIVAPQGRTPLSADARFRWVRRGVDTIPEHRADEAEMA